jgi:hypothetical protein
LHPVAILELKALEAVQGAGGIPHDGQGMSIDPVAVYAAVVATGALGLRVYAFTLA